MPAAEHFPSYRHCLAKQPFRLVQLFYLCEETGEAIERPNQARVLRASEPPAAELAFDRELAAVVLEDQQAALVCDRVSAREHRGLESLPPIALREMRLAAKVLLP